MMPEYRLTCMNNSTVHGNFIICQKPPQHQTVSQLNSVAWMSRPAAPGTRVSFAWSTNLGFVWGERGTFGGRTIFTAYQYVSGSPNCENVIDLSIDSFGAPEFLNLRPGGQAGTMTVRQLNAVFDFPVQVGIALGGMPIYTVNFNANITSTFIPHWNRCWVLFGSHIAGELVDNAAYSNALEVDFSASHLSQQVSLTPANTLSLFSGRTYGQQIFWPG